MLAAIRAFASLLMSLPQESDFDSFQSVLGQIMSTLATACNLVAAGELSEAAAIAYAESLIISNPTNKLFIPDEASTKSCRPMLKLSSEQAARTTQCPMNPANIARAVTLKNMNAGKLG